MNTRPTIVAFGVLLAVPACVKKSTLTQEVLAQPQEQHRAPYLRGGKIPSGKEIAWKSKIKGGVTSSVALFGSTLYITSMFRKEDKGWVHALDFKTGKERWTTPLGARSYTSPAVTAQFVIVGSFDGYVYCLDRVTGAERWKFKTGGPARGTPYVWRDLVIIGSSDSKLYALNLSSGEKRWTFDSKGPILSFPVAYRDVLYLGSQDKKLYALNPESGELLWTFETEGDIRAMPVLDENRVYASSFDGKVYALTAATGQLVWAYDAGSPLFGGSALYRGRLYAVGMKTGVHAIDLKNGKRIWKAAVFGDAETRNPLTIVDDIIYTTTRNGTLVAIDTADGNERWRLELGGTTYYAPLVRRGRIYVGTTEGWFYCIK
jgi:outer membrane protein assembly factor BamB